MLGEFYTGAVALLLVKILCKVEELETRRQKKLHQDFMTFAGNGKIKYPGKLEKKAAKNRKENTQRGPWLLQIPF